MSELGLPAIAAYAPDESAVLADLALADPASPATAPLDNDLRDSAERALEEGDIPALLKLLEEVSRVLPCAPSPSLSMRRGILSMEM